MSARIEERYAKAVRSSHLEVTRSTEDGDLDLVIAAGMAETMGVLLARLKGEWDGQKGQLAVYRKEQTRLLREAEKLTRDVNPETQAESRKQADWLRAEAEREGVTARALILMEMRSLSPAKQAIYNLAMRQAVKKACNSPEAAIAALVGRVLDVWLDRLCTPCDGRGSLGGYKAQRILCNKCGGSGSRRSAPISKDLSEQMFGLWLLGLMDTKCADALKKISNKTSKRETRPAEISESDAAGLSARIADLKSPAAEAD